MKHRMPCVVALLLAFSLVVAGPAFAAPAGPPAPIIGADAPGALAGRYIVVFKADAPSAAVDQAAAGLDHTAGTRLLYRYSAALKGFAGSLPEQALDALRHNPNVDYIEADQVMSIDATETGATWGLDRIDRPCTLARPRVYL